MTTDIATLGIRIDTSAVQQGVRSLNDLSTAGQRTGQSLTHLEQVTRTIRDQLRNVAAALAVRQLVQYADTWASIQGRLNLVSASTNQLVNAQRALFDISQRSRVGLESTVDLYTRIARATRSLGLDQQKLFGITETINRTLVISGASAAGAQAALMQLGQGFASGVLRGEELNSVLEQTPRLAEAIAKGMGVSVGELRKLGEQGKLTTGVLVDALTSQARIVEEEFSRMPKTVSQSFTQLSNAVLKFIGEADSASGISGLLGAAVSALARNISEVATAIGILIASKAASFLAGMTSAVINQVRAVLSLAAATRTQQVAAVSAARTMVTNTAATVGYSVAATAALAVERQTVLTRLVTAEATVAAARATAAATATTAASTAATLALTNAERQRAIVLAELTLLDTRNAAVRAAGVAATTAQAAAQTQLVAATVATTGIFTRLGAAVSATYGVLLLNPFIAIAAAIGAAVAALYFYRDANVEILGVTAQIRDFATATWGVISTGVVAAVDTFLNVFPDMSAMAAAVFNAISGFISAFVSGVGALAKGFVNVFIGAFVAVGSTAQNVVMGMVHYFQQGFEKIRQLGLGLGQGLSAALKGDFTFKAFSTAFSQERLTLLDIAKDTGAGIKDAMTRDYVGDFTKQVVSTAKTLRENRQELDRFRSKGTTKTPEAEIQKPKVDEKAFKAAAKLQADLTAKMDDWRRASVENQKELESEYALFGKSAEQRKIVAEQIKIETEVQKFLDDAKKQGQILSAVQISKLKEEAEARKANIASIEGQKQAISGAEQLRVENERFAAESIYDEKERTAAILAVESEMWQKRLTLAGEGTEAEKLLRQHYDQWLANQQSKPVLDKFKQTAKGIEEALYQSITGGGTSAWKKLLADMKAEFAKLVLSPIIKPLTMMLASAFTPGMAQASGDVAAAASGSSQSGFSPANLLQAGKTLWSGFSSGFSSLGASASKFVMQAGNAIGSPTLSSFAPMAGTAASVAAAAGTTIALGRFISGDYNVFKSKITSGIGSLLVGGPVMGVVNRLFGRKPKEIESLGISGNFSGEQFSGERVTKFLAKGGWLRSDKRTTERSALSEDVQQQFTASFVSLRDSTAQFAKALGVSSTAVEGYSKVIDLKLDKDQEKAKAQISDFFTGVADEMAGLVGSFSEFSRGGESVGETLARISTNFAALDEMLVLLGRTSQEAFGVVGLASVNARERLVGLAGGLGALQAGFGFFAENFLTEQERLRPTINAVTAAMVDLGFAGVTTATDFANLVKSVDLSSEAGAKLYVQLLGLAPAFKVVSDSAAKATQEAIAQARAAAAATAEMRAQAVESATSELQAAYEREYSYIQEAAGRLNDFARSIREFSKSLLVSELSPLSPEQKLFELRRQFEETAQKAKGGDENAQSGLQDLAQAYLEANRGYFASTEAGAAEFERVRTVLEEVASAADVQTNAAAQQLAILRSQVDGLLKIDASVLTVAEAIRNLNLAKGVQSGAIRADELGNTAFSANLPTNSDLVKLWYESNPNAAVPDTGGVDYWTQQLSNPSLSQADVKAAFAASVATVTGTTPLSISQFALGGVFSDGVVSQPTNFNVGQMGEAGPEAIMPLTRGSKGLGVRATLDTANVEDLLKEIVRRLDSTNETLSAANTQRGAAAMMTVEQLDKVAGKQDAIKRELARNA